MATLATTIQRGRALPTPRRLSSQFLAFQTLVMRRIALTLRTPRELVVPVVNPIVFAIVIAPALADIVGRFRGGLDYMSFVALGTVGLLVPINALFAGISVFVDRDSGAQRDLLAAPIRRPLMVLSNLSVVMMTTALQLTALLIASLLRGAHFNTDGGGILWFVGGAGFLAVGMYGVAETLANRMHSQEEYIGIVPAVAILPYFFAGSLFPITSLPAWLGIVAKFIPLTHALALIRYGLLDHRGLGLRDIWGMTDTNLMAALSLGVLAVFAVTFTLVSIRVFKRRAVG